MLPRLEQSDKYAAGIKVMTRRGKLTERQRRIQRFGSIFLAIEMSIVLSMIGFGSLIVPKAFGLACGISSLIVCGWLLLLVFFAFRHASAIWPTVLLQMSMILVVAVPAAVLVDGIPAKCFFIAMAAIVVVNGLGKLAASCDRATDLPG
jgi:hypothetical protein